MLLPEKALVIIPAFNEEMNIGGVLSRLLDKTARRHIVVIGDGSTGRTAAIVREMAVTI